MRFDPVTALRQRRSFLTQASSGLGAIALHALGLTGCNRDAYIDQHPRANGTPENVIFLFMEGGPSQLELFDFKPELKVRDGEVAPASLTDGQRFAFMDDRFGGPLRLLGTRRSFARHGERGTWISELLPHTAKIADDLAIVRSVHTDLPNHAPAMALMNTGFFRYGRPSMGAWMLYALGDGSKNLPGFVVMRSGPNGPRGGMQNWTSGFLPAHHQGVPLRDNGAPILNLDNPTGISRKRQERSIEAIAGLNRIALARHGDEDTEARIAAYELAGRMQLEAPEATDLSSESRSVLKDYGADPDVPSFARNCILARRLVERGVRFIQLYHTDWDHHGISGRTLGVHLEQRCREVDRACRALIEDLRSRGLLERTLVVWGGEFGRTPIGEVAETSVGRNHHVHAGTMWLAGAGIRPTDYGETDDLGFFVQKDPVHVHDLHATLLAALGLNHRELTFRSQGRDFRLTDTGGRVIPELLFGGV